MLRPILLVLDFLTKELPAPALPCGYKSHIAVQLVTPSLSPKLGCLATAPHSTVLLFNFSTALYCILSPPALEEPSNSTASSSLGSACFTSGMWWTLLATQVSA